MIYFFPFRSYSLHQLLVNNCLYATNSTFWILYILLYFFKVYGELPEGLLVTVSVGKARNMLLPNCAVLNSLGKHFVFEVAIGMNGAVWVKCGDVVENIIIRNAIINSQYLNDIEIEAMIDVMATSYRTTKKNRN